MSHLRALLLTDVVDSTKLSLRVGDEEMARLWAAHDRAARDLCLSGMGARSTSPMACCCCSTRLQTRWAMPWLISRR
jgi:hypothetical protein